ncbi:MAG TPA: hypothetical protein PLD20_18840, partial [Blastocatellia bacterium]|nr:hypothetical protein [Blastocatellia bacterium]HMX26400.1 hypothetical protein [Blastocatellia bacterium]HMZ20002.1 hypothetical protein [Blastocatellia bacterium]HNG34826.1 hypothetical protein [Blastocatellia bacterium]
MSPNKIGYSQRGVTSGFTFVARRAGIQQAGSATLRSKNATPPKVSSSAGRTPFSNATSRRVSANTAL